MAHVLARVSPLNIVCLSLFTYLRQCDSKTASHFCLQNSPWPPRTLYLKTIPLSLQRAQFHAKRQFDAACACAERRKISVGKTIFAVVVRRSIKPALKRRMRSEYGVVFCLLAGADFYFQTPHERTKKKHSIGAEIRS